MDSAELVLFPKTLDIIRYYCSYTRHESWVSGIISFYILLGCDVDDITHHLLKMIKIAKVVMPMPTVCSHNGMK